MYDVIEAFLDNPTAGGYRRIREAILFGDSGPPKGSQLTELAALHQRGEAAAVLRRVQAMMPNWALCPRVHFFAARAADRSGDVEEAELERFLLDRCLRGLQATGDGGPERPYLATYSTDSHDLLWSLGRCPCGQALIRRETGCFDVVSCASGSMVWFDVTDAVRCVGPPSTASRLRSASTRDVCIAPGEGRPAGDPGP